MGRQIVQSEFWNALCRPLPRDTCDKPSYPFWLLIECNLHQQSTFYNKVIYSVESGQSMPFGVREFWALSWCQHLPAGWTWASSLTFTSTDFLIHKLEIIVGKSRSSTKIMVFYIITQLRKASFWKSVPGLFWLPLAFLAQDLFFFFFLTSSLSSLRRRASWRHFVLEASYQISKETFCTFPFLTKSFVKCRYPEVATPRCLQQSCISEEKDMRGNPPRNNINLPSLYFPMSSPNYLLWAIDHIVREEGQIGWWLERYTQNRKGLEFGETVTLLIWVGTSRPLLL